MLFKTFGNASCEFGFSSSKSRYLYDILTLSSKNLAIKYLRKNLNFVQILENIEKTREKISYLIKETVSRDGLGFWWRMVFDDEMD